MKNNESDYEALYSAMEKIIEKKVYEIIDRLGIEASDFGTVSRLDNSTTSVMLSSGEVVNNLLNASGEVLSVGDKVKIFGSRKNMSNRYIGIKYE